MAEFALRAEGLSKQYRIGQMRGGYDTLRDELATLARAVRRSGRGPREREYIWAVRDVSFEIEQGEVVGIIGRNGAGKSTLLRVLSRITEPTSGYVDVRGRLGSLLEVGTGFHPELSGRENIFLNGAILGMRRTEIARKFDEIVEFAGVEKFIDTPVKRYSSGMYVRLAFSVAAHLELEVMLVDEVLAVGDAEFQRRCLGKMQEIGQSGRTVLFVSHSMPTIARLCDRVILLDGGSVVADGPTQEVIPLYLTSDSGTTGLREWADRESAPGDEVVRLRRIRVIDEAGETVESTDVRQRVGIEVTVDVLHGGIPFVPWLAVYNDQGQHVFSAMNTAEEWKVGLPTGRYTSRAFVPANLLNEGTMVVTVALNTLSSGKNLRRAFVDHAVAFQVLDPGEGDTSRGNYGGQWPGPVRPALDWSTAMSTVDAELEPVSKGASAR